LALVNESESIKLQPNDIFLDHFRQNSVEVRGGFWEIVCGY
jgi:hypothetical protein